MRVLRLEDFEKMAREVVNDHFQSKVPLEDRLVKAAQDGELNPDQIQNLVQLANTLAHLTIFDNKTGDDRIIDFSPVDPSNVLNKVYQGGCPAEVSMSSEEPSHPDKVQDFFSDLPSLTEKIKEVMAPEMSSGDSDSGSSVTIIKIKKVAEELDNRKAELAYEFKEEFDKLASDFAKLYGPDFDEFEKDAVAYRGESTYPILSELRRCLKMPSSKVASAHDALSGRKGRIVDPSTPEMKTLNKLLKLSEDYSTHATASEALRAKLGVRL